ncbi:hypothetical protein Q5O14_14345 [Eubacteriaceae bacterium ES2]|nr:hypothetical protein Q5O14_14345 [Eubacteriaceae bacterium ES2]
MKKTKRLKMRGIPRRDFIRYFDKLSEGSLDSCYFGSDWQAEILPEYFESTGSIKMNCVEIEISVDSDRFDSFIFQFRKYFLRGGG